MRIIRYGLLFWALAAALITRSAPLLGQTPGTGAIAGTVYDPSGLAVFKANVLIVNESTHAFRLIATSSDGVFTAPLLIPGLYSVTVKFPGFDEGAAHSISVVVSEISSLAFRLAIARQGESVEVTADAEMAQFQSAALGRAVQERAIQALPLANRNYTQILSLSPGVVVAIPNAATLGRGTQDVTANGNKTTANNIQFNGIDANNLAQNSAANDGEEVGVAIPAPDTIQEFKVQTGNYDATYGRGTGANVDVISKAGTNHTHGSAWEFIRNDVLNANDFFSNLTGQHRPVLKQNQFGGSFGGPIKSNKSFFFVAYQGLRSSNGDGDKVTVFLPRLTEDRSEATLGSQFCPANHLDTTGQPAAGYLTHAGGTQVQCDGSNINPVTLKLLNLKFRDGTFAVPGPQILLPSSDPTQLPIGESTFATPATYNEDQFSANIDEAISERNQFSERFFYSRAPTMEPFSPNAANVPGWGTSELDKNTMFVLADTHVFNSSLVNIARYGYMRFDGTSTVANPISSLDLGMQSPIGGSAQDIPSPGITVDGLFTTGDAGTPAQSQLTNTFVWQDTLSLTRSRHSLRMGAEVKRHQVEVDAPFSTTGLLDIRTFDDLLLGQSATQNGSPGGISNVTLSNGSSGLFRKDERYADLAAFVQDDIRITPRLSIFPGLRYEIFGPPTEVHGRLATFDPAIASGTAPSTGTLSGFIVPSNFPGAIPPGVVKTSYSGLWSKSYHDVSPRLGFVLRLRDKPTVLLRGGYGIYFDRISAGLVEGTLGQPPFSLFQFLTDAANGGATLQQPFTPALPHNSSYPIFTSRIPGGGPTLSAVSPHITDPYTQEYNLNLQFAFARDYLLEAGFVGTRALHAVGCNEFNQALLANPTNPVNGETTNTVANVVQRVRFAGLSPGSEICRTSYNANYNSLQTSLTKRLGRGLELLGSYTWSKNLDETSGSSGSQVFEAWLLTNDQTNPRQAYGLTDFDRANRGVLSLVYQTPNVSSGPRLVKQALADWQISGIFVAQSGSPITVLDSNAGAVYGNFPFESRAQRPTMNPQTSGSLYSRVLGRYLDAAAFPSAPQAPNSSSPIDTDFGNSSVGFIRGPGQRNIDFAVERSFHVTESSSFRFRAEFFNLTNTPNFSNPNNNLNAGPAFGAITSTSNNPRIVQFAGKYMF